MIIATWTLRSMILKFMTTMMATENDSKHNHIEMFDSCDIKSWNSWSPEGEYLRCLTSQHGCVWYHFKVFIIVVPNFNYTILSIKASKGYRVSQKNGKILFGHLKHCTNSDTSNQLTDITHSSHSFYDNWGAC